jgi:hypothetical protein
VVIQEYFFKYPLHGPLQHLQQILTVPVFPHRLRQLAHLGFRDISHAVGDLFDTCDFELADHLCDGVQAVSRSACLDDPLPFCIADSCSFLLPQQINGRVELE